MATITATVSDSQNAAIAAEATARSAAAAPVTAADIASGLVGSHADRGLRDKYVAWYKSLGVAGMAALYDAAQ